MARPRAHADKKSVLTLWRQLEPWQRRNSLLAGFVIAWALLLGVREDGVLQMAGWATN
jgi:hypothetical protein